MMGVRTLAVLCLATAGYASAWGQGDASGAERARIEAVRAQKTAELDAEDAACLSRFAVSDCQSQVGQRRRQMLSELKRQEDSLNAAQRQQKGVEQLQRTEDKAADDVRRRQEAQAAAENKTQQEDRQRALDDKRKSHKAQATAPKAAASKSTSVLDPQEISKNREAYLDKQKALEKRRQDRDQRVLDHGRGGPPLPSPP